MKTRLIYLVYQAGIANVFEVQAFPAPKRNARLLMQHAFVAAEWFASGMAAMGATVRIASCNRAGDISECEWTEGMEDCPFRDQACPNKPSMFRVVS